VELPTKLNSSISHRPELDKEHLQHLVSDLLVSTGFTEAMSNSLTSAEYVEETDDLNADHNVNILNPLSIDLNVMRQSLVFNALEAVKLNQNHGSTDVKLYEFGQIYRKFNDNYNEEKQLCIVMSGNNGRESWNGDSNAISFYHLKGACKMIFDRLGVSKKEKIKAGASSLFADGLSYSYEKRKVAELGWANKKLKKKFSLKHEAYIAVINWDVLIELANKASVQFTELPKSQAINRDLSLLIDEAVSYKEIESIAKNVNNDLLQSVDLFDVYNGKNLPDGKKSYAVRFVLHDPSKTLEDKQIDTIMGKIQKSLIDKLSAELR